MSSNEVKRRSYTSHLSTAMNKLQAEITSKVLDESKIKSLLEQVETKFARVQDIVDTLQAEMEDDVLEADIEKMDTLENQVIEIKVTAETILEKMKAKAEPSPAQPPQSPAQPPLPIQVQLPIQPAVKLPDIKLLEFNGEEEQFPSFIDQFTAIIDNNPQLTDVEKFGYLRGAAKVDIIQYFPMTEENYKPALARLKQEYGDNDMIAKKHLNALLDLSKRKKPTNNKELQELYTFIECKLACLEALKQPIDKNNEMLITLIYRQMPKPLKQNIAKLDKSHTTVENVLKLIREYITTCKHMQNREASSEDSDCDTDINFQNTEKYKSHQFRNQYQYKYSDGTKETAPPTSSATSLPVVSQRYNRPCAFCEGSHSAIQCHNITDINQRKEIAKNANRCFNCLFVGHRQSECRSTGRCRKCNRKHHTSLCSNQTQVRGNDTQINQNFQGMTTATSLEANSSVLLQMAETELRKPLGVKIIKANIFFDLGSQFSYILKDVKEELELDVIRKDILEQNTFGRTEAETVTSDVVKVQILKNGFSKDITIHTSDYICGELPSFRISKRKLQELKKINLAHPNCIKEGSHKISLLIGADLYWELVGVESITTSYGMRANKSKLGWLLSGTTDSTHSFRTSIHLNIISNVSTQALNSMKLDEISPPAEWLTENFNQEQYTNHKSLFETRSEETSYPIPKKITRNNQVSILYNSATNINTFIDSSDNALDGIEEADDWDLFKIQNAIQKEDFSLQWFWNTEHVGITPEEKEPSTLEKFEHSLKYNKKSKRYQVSLPVKPNLLQMLPDNYCVSSLRLQSVLGKLNKPGNEELLSCYNETIMDQLRNGVIESVPTASKSCVIHYLPHHCIIRKDKPTTAVRIVYDGSAKAHKSAISLNKCLHAGPSLVNNLVAVLLRFRMFKIGVVADIRKAFLQISLTEEDRDLTRFLWRKEGKLENPIEVYRFCRVPFGLTSSPFLLNAVIIHHLNEYKEKYPTTVNNLLNSTYVDDVCTGAQTKEEAVKLIEETNHIMKEASLELTKWISNSPILKNSNVDPSEQSKETTIKLLGIIWDTASDEFYYNMNSIIATMEKLKPTKRTVLKVVAKLYDPNGFLSPFVITGKIIFQRITIENSKWDDELSSDIKSEWTNWCKELYLVEKLKLPRCVNIVPTDCIELIGFCDASLNAYAALVYIRCCKDNLVKTHLLMARSRVAPIKTLTIPRLELLGAVLLARLMSTIKETLSEWTIRKTTFYSDSSNVLFWISGTNKWNSYISKRIEEIHKLSSKQEWLHCPGYENPADLATRGISMSSLLKSKEWFQGPEWMSQPEMNYVRTTCSPAPSDECFAEEKLVSHVNLLVQEKCIENLIPIDKYSSLRKMCRITAYLLIFIVIYLKREVKPMLEYIAKAESIWIKNEQRKFFHKELNNLQCKSKKPAPTLIRQLDLFIDDTGIIRCTGRYKYSTLPYQRKYPILLPKDSVFTKLLIEDRHKRMNHSGLKTTLTEIREEFYIPRGKRLIKYILNRCITCRKITAKPFKPPPTPPLPLVRLSECPPFTNTGVDFAGPLYVKERGASISHKSYIALFTCASTRALSLELVPDLTSHSFKNSMIRFISTRGRPQIMISDNAKTFQKSAEDLQCLITRSPACELIEQNRITWLFYLEKSPWWGGFIERMVSTVKSNLRKVLQRSFLSYDEMITLLKQIEAVINSRPITTIYDDDVEQPLTPSHLLIGKRATQLPEVSPSFYDTEGRSTYRESLITNFMKRWKKEYLQELQDYHISTRKIEEPERIPKIGEVVLMKEDTPRATWNLARITNIFISRDKRIRSVEIQKANGNIARRPPQLLVPLEM